MFFQTLLQHLLGKKRSKKIVAKPAHDQALSPMAQSIMQKLAQHDKHGVSTPEPTSSDQPPSSSQAPKKPHSSN